VFPLRKTCTEQIFALVRMQVCNHADAQTFKRFKRYKAYATLHDIKFGMLQVRENEISLRKWFGGTAHLRSLEGTLPTRGKYKRYIIPGPSRY